MDHIENKIFVFIKIYIAEHFIPFTIEVFWITSVRNKHVMMAAIHGYGKGRHQKCDLQSREPNNILFDCEKHPTKSKYSALPFV